MIFPKDFEGKIGFDTIRKTLSEKCESRLGREEVAGMKFTFDYEELKIELGQTEEMSKLLRNKDVPTDSTYDILPWLSEIKTEGAYLNGEKLQKIGVTLASMGEVAKFFNNRKEEETETPCLKDYFRNMPTFPEILNEIERAIEETGGVRDSASEGLREIRQQLRKANGSMQRTMQGVMQRALKEGLIESDVTPGIRDGRLVIPLAAGNKRNIAGIVHDVSATGKTVFIEPAEVVEAGNRIKELEREEEREIIEVLKKLADILRPEIEGISEGTYMLGKLDFIRAKAMYALENGGELPHIDKKPEIDWFHAVHPLLQHKLRERGEEPVALDINLNKEKRILIISGPNAGGKSVCLKTVAIVQYMMQCGLLPTLYSNSRMGIFKNVFIDIGDEQSIENELSTYSSHLANMKYFLLHANKYTLILADEMGSGTEPQIGGALAQSILEKLGQSGCMGVVTTHYQNLKTFAETEPGFVNGAMLYDRQHLQPTFMLSIGVPGSSFALDIASKSGLPKDVIEGAKNLVGDDYVDLDKYVLDIQRDRKYWKNKRLSIKEKEHKLDKILEDYEAMSAELKHQRGTIIKAAKEEAKNILAEANGRIERSIHEIRKAEAEKEKTREIRKSLEEYKKKLESEKEEIPAPEILRPLKHKSKKLQATPGKINKEKWEDIKPGDFVMMKDGRVKGEVLSIEGKNAEVAFGLLRTKVNIDKLMKTSKPKDSTKEGSFTISSTADSGSRERQLNFKTEIDVRGMRADEALQAVTYFLDDAIQFNARRLRILHGTGHGILKQLIRQQLQSNPNVLNFEDEDVRFGGAGITVVDL